jgi:hypothetical protein
MVVSLFLMLRTVLLTSNCVGSFQRSTIPRAGWLLDARQDEDLLWTKDIRLFFYILSVDVYLLFCETTYLSEHTSSPEYHTVHTFFPKELFLVWLMIPYLGMEQATDQNIHNVHSGILLHTPLCDPLSP